MKKHICSRISSALTLIRDENYSQNSCKNIKEFTKICASWTNEEESGKCQSVNWKQEYCNTPHAYLPIVKVDSHQLIEKGGGVNGEKKV